MKANYHTHTARCGHATGTDEDYVLAAIEQGFDELGFSDHVPWPYQNGFSHPGVRMSVLQLSQYLNSVRELAERYRDQLANIASASVPRGWRRLRWISPAPPSYSTMPGLTLTSPMISSWHAMPSFSP